MVKKLVFYVLILGLAIVFWQKGYFFAPTVESQSPRPIPAPTPIETKTLHQGIGPSMLPTMTDGGMFYAQSNLTPKAGDIVAFDCIDRCYYQGTYEATHGFVKRLIEIREDGAWWVLGDNRDHSWDSADYGWILPSERSNVGVVVEILN